MEQTINEIRAEQIRAASAVARLEEQQKAGTTRLEEKIEGLREDVQQVIADRKADREADAPALAWVRAWRALVIWGSGTIIVAVVTAVVAEIVGAWKWVSK